jgi:two-component system sensor histidine kinase BaeS
VKVIPAILGFLAIVIAGLAWFEVEMQPTAGERVRLALVFAAMAAAAAVASWALPRWASSSRSVRRTVVALSATAVVIAAAGILLAATTMFLSSHDLSLLLIVLGVAVLAGIGFALAVSRPWVADLEQMAATADRVAAGDLSARTGIERHDEVGRLADAIDTMAGRLADAAEVRDQTEAARRRLFAAIGHDLRTPLASLRVAVEALRDGVASDPDRYLRSMQHDVEALASLIDDLFLLARIEAGAFEVSATECDVTEVADEAIEVLRPLALAGGVQVRLEAPGRALVVGGPEALGRVIRNVLDNAIRHAPEGTEVTVAVSNGDGATVSVTDAGPGFPADFVDRAFGDFEREDPARGRGGGGAGLGLAIARGLVTTMGGKIWAEPGPGGKVAFRVPGSRGEG